MENITVSSYKNCYFSYDVTRQKLEKAPRQHLATSQDFQHIFSTPKLAPPSRKNPAKISASIKLRAQNIGNSSNFEQYQIGAFLPRNGNYIFKNRTQPLYMFFKHCKTAKKFKISSLYAELTRLELETANVEKYLALYLCHVCGGINTYRKIIFIIFQSQ